VGSDLGQRPIVPEVEVQDLTLVLGQQRAIALVEREDAPAGLKGVKWHSLTV